MAAASGASAAADARCGHPSGEGVEAFDAAGGAGHGGVAQLHDGQVVGLQHGEAERSRAVGVEGVAEGPEVVQRLRHLLAVDVEHRRMHPVSSEAMAGGLGLGAFVLVVGKRQVRAATVDVEAVAEDVERHRHALDVPAGPPRSPGRLPGGFAGLGGLPEREVERIVLAFVGGDHGPGPARAGRRPPVAQRAVPVEGRHVEVHAPALDHVGLAPIDELADDRDHPVDVLGRSGAMVRVGDAEDAQLLDVDGGEPLGQLGFGRSGGRSALDDLVVDVGDVRHHRHLLAPPAQVPHEHVVGHRSAGVAEVGNVVHRRTAGIDRHRAGLAGFEVAEATGQGVGETHGRQDTGGLLSPPTAVPAPARSPPTARERPRSGIEPEAYRLEAVGYSTELGGSDHRASDATVPDGGAPRTATTGGSSMVRRHGRPNLLRATADRDVGARLGGTLVGLRSTLWAAEICPAVTAVDAREAAEAAGEWIVANQEPSGR